MYNTIKNLISNIIHNDQMRLAFGLGVLAAFVLVLVVAWLCMKWKTADNDEVEESEFKISNWQTNKGFSSVN